MCLATLMLNKKYSVSSQPRKGPSQTHSSVSTHSPHSFSCQEGYKLRGDTCVNINECHWLPCTNGGRCIDHDPPVRYECICPVGHTGLNCELELASAGAIMPSKDFILTVIGCLLTLMGMQTFLVLIQFLLLYLDVFVQHIKCKLVFIASGKLYKRLGQCYSKHMTYIDLW